MHRLLDKLGLGFLCAGLLTQINNSIISVSVLLICTALSELSQILPKTIGFSFLAFYAVLCFFFPELCLAMPLLIYDALALPKHRIPVLLLFGAAFLSTATHIESSVSFLLFGSIVMSVLLWHHAHMTLLLKEECNLQRDSAQERQLLLSEKNRRIAEQQDNELYAATLKERNRIAREIHDNVGHTLTRCLLQIGALQILNKDTALDESIGSIKESLNNAMTSIRSSVHNLHDTTIHLKKQIQECILPLQKQCSVHMDCTVSETAPKEIKLCFIGIVKEAVSNIIKHSNASEVTVTLLEHPAFYQLVVQDNGSNAILPKETDGMGLSGMKERMDKVGGILNLSASKSGFRVFASIPKKEEFI